MLSDVFNGLWVDRILFAGFIAGALSVLAYIPYIIDTLARRTQPCRATWLIWAVLASISGASNLYEGAGASMIFISVQVAGTLIVFGLSMTRGSGPFFTPHNVMILVTASVGLLVWYITDSAVYALMISIGISALGGSTTVWKAFRNPKSETLSTWVISAMAACFGVLSVGAFDPLLLAYPVYLLVLYASIVLAMTLGTLTGQEPYVESFVWSSRRKQVRRMPPPAVNLHGLAAPASPATSTAFLAPASVEVNVRQRDVA